MDFNRYLSSTNVVHAELWGVLMCMQTACEKGWGKVCFEMDSEVSFNLIMHGYNVMHPCYALVAAIKNMAPRNWRMVFNHCYRENRIG